jgi:hypothetical protein
MDKDTKLLYCKKCQEKTIHIPVGFRKPFELQLYRCTTKNCGEERSA